MPRLVSINGRIVSPSEAVVSADDRAFYFGDGVYEAMRRIQGTVWLYDEHMARFRRSLDSIAIRPVDLDAVRRQIDEIVEVSDLPDAIIYFHMTRGTAPRDHTWQEPIEPNLFISVRAYTERTENWERGVTVVTQPDLRWKRCDIKSLNLLPNCLAKQAAQDAGAYEAILVNDAGQVTEGTRTSFLIVRDGEVVAPPNGPHILPGITRAKVLDVARAHGIPVREAFFTPEVVTAADEAFLAGTGEDLSAVVRVDTRPIGAGRPGPLTRRLLDLYRQAIRDELGVVYP